MVKNSPEMEVLTFYKNITSKEPEQKEIVEEDHDGILEEIQITEFFFVYFVNKFYYI